MSGEGRSFQSHGNGRAGEIGFQFFKDGFAATTHRGRHLAVAIPGFGHMPVSGEQARSDYESRSRDPGAKTLPVAGDMINPIDVRDRIARGVDRASRKRLLLL